MENDPNKKDSKGKRLIKKALRRRSSNQSSTLELGGGGGVSRSKSEESKQGLAAAAAAADRDNAPLPAPDAPDAPPPEPATADTDAGPSARKMVDIQEDKNLVYEEVATGSTTDKSRTSLKLDENNSEPGTSRRALKRVGSLVQMRIDK